MNKPLGAENRDKNGPYVYLVPKIFVSKRFGVTKYFQARSPNFDVFSNKSSLSGAWSLKKKTHLNFDLFRLISRDSVHIFQNWFLHWNRWFKPFVLSTMNPIIGRFFFGLLKELWNLKKWKKCRLEGSIWKSEIFPMLSTSDDTIFSLPIISFHEKCIFT